MPESNNEFTDQTPLANVFEERAENLSRQELDLWTQETPRAREIDVKLKGPGAKLLSGPRGSGKSTFLRKAYFDLLDSGETLSVYVNYARSLALEPMFHHRSNALQIFRQWVLAKIIVGVHVSFKMLGKSIPADLSDIVATSSKLIHDLETGAFDSLESRLLSPEEVVHLLEHWTHLFGFRRCVLMMDDAAHAFSSEQQREFFEIFRLLRSRVVSAKAAVYPGITSYSPNFHVGHEAELLEAWHQPDDPQYLHTMKAMVQRRLPQDLYAALADRVELLDYLALASFGLPRGFLNMVQQLLAIEEGAQIPRPSVATADTAVKDHADSVRGIFTALRQKLPRFKNFISTGEEVERDMTARIRSFNNEKELHQKAVTIAIQEPVEKELVRILSLFEYAGIVRPLDKLSRGVKGVFRRYVIHYAILINENSLNLGKSASVKAVVTALSKRDPHALVRVAGTTLLGADYESKCTIDLPPCQNCNTHRFSEEQRFCMKCGAQLAESSLYRDLVKAPIRVLPLTRRKINDITARTTIRNIQDILLDEDMQLLLTVPYIGPVWARRIRNAAEEYVSV